ncbi:UNVERIFIED_ORG: hypothetical protein FHW05_002313 [Pantoea agglomerans]
MKEPRRQKEVTKDLCDLADRLTEIAITECDVTQWPGHGKAVTEMTKEERGDRYWSKQNATATITLIKNLHNLVSQREGGQKDRMNANPNAADVEETVEQQAARAEREAKAAIKKAMNAAKH